VLSVSGSVTLPANAKFWIGAAALAGGTLLLVSSANATVLDAGYDGVYAAQCPRIPVEYLRALAAKESDTNPREAKGLLQVVESVRLDYNKKFGTSYTRQDLLIPAVNVKIACDLFETIARGLGGVDWSDIQQVNVFTLAWNAGWSESRGVTGVVAYLKQQGQPVTIDTVSAAAATLPWASKYLTDSSKVSWCKSVGSLYLHELRQNSA